MSWRTAAAAAQPGRPQRRPARPARRAASLRRQRPTVARAMPTARPLPDRDRLPRLAGSAAASASSRTHDRIRCFGAEPGVRRPARPRRRTARHGADERGCRREAPRRLDRSAGSPRGARRPPPPAARRPADQSAQRPSPSAPGWQLAAQPLGLPAAASRSRPASRSASIRSPIAHAGQAVQRDRHRVGGLLARPRQRHPEPCAQEPLHRVLQEARPGRRASRRPARAARAAAPARNGGGAAPRPGGRAGARQRRRS